MTRRAKCSDDSHSSANLKKKRLLATSLKCTPVCLIFSNVCKNHMMSPSSAIDTDDIDGLAGEKEEVAKSVGSKR